MRREITSFLQRKRGRFPSPQAAMWKISLLCTMAGTGIASRTVSLTLPRGSMVSRRTAPSSGSLVVAAIIAQNWSRVQLRRRPIAHAFRQPLTVWRVGPLNSPSAWPSRRLTRQTKGGGPYGCQLAPFVTMELAQDGDCSTISRQSSQSTSRLEQSFDAFMPGTDRYLV